METPGVSKTSLLLKYNGAVVGKRTLVSRSGS
jgi:hypothetical protein